jgi:propionyl-CoA carboxylase alpha chain
MIAKLVTHAPTREEAIAAQSRALDEFAIAGIRHNIPFLSALMQHPRWQEGRLSTGFIAEEFKGGFHAIPAEGERAQVIAAVAAAIDIVLGDRKRRISGQMTGREVTRERRRAVWLDKTEVALDVARERDGIVVRFLADDGKPGRARVLVSAWKPGDPVWLGTIDGKVIAVQVRAMLNGFVLSHHGVESKTFV